MRFPSTATGRVLQRRLTQSAFPRTQFVTQQTNSAIVNGNNKFRSILGPTGNNKRFVATEAKGQQTPGNDSDSSAKKPDDDDVDFSELDQKAQQPEPAEWQKAILKADYATAAKLAKENSPQGLEFVANQCTERAFLVYSSSEDERKIAIQQCQSGEHFASTWDQTTEGLTNPVLWAPLAQQEWVRCDSALTRFFYNPTQKTHFLAHFKGFFDFF